MARNVGTIVQNNFSGGVKTEATGLNFPENSATDALNVVFDPIGKVHRRLGIDIEGSATTISYSESEGVVNEFLWRSVSNVGGVVFLVLQVGLTIYFYEVTREDALSQNLVPAGIDLSQYTVAGSSDNHLRPCTFASGGGDLYIAHPGIDPLIVTYDSEEEEFVVQRIIIKIRDTAGLDEPGDPEPSFNPVNLTTEHHYNLKNQGWYKDVRVGTVNNEGN